MINHAVFAVLALTPVAALAADRVCAPSSMLKVVTAMDVPGAPNRHFGKVPKTVYRTGERYGRVEEALNPSSGLQILVNPTCGSRTLRVAAATTIRILVPHTTFARGFLVIPPFKAASSTHWNLAAR